MKKVANSKLHSVGNELVNTGKASASQVVAAIVSYFRVHVFSLEQNLDS